MAQQTPRRDGAQEASPFAADRARLVQRALGARKLDPMNPAHREIIDLNESFIGGVINTEEYVAKVKAAVAGVEAKTAS